MFHDLFPVKKMTIYMVQKEYIGPLFYTGVMFPNPHGCMKFAYTCYCVKYVKYVYEQ